MSERERKDDAAGRATPPGAEAYVQPGRARVLVVEDDATVADVIGEVLADQPFETSFAASAEEAIERIASAFPDLILTDISLPGKSGLEVMRHARAIDPEVAVILMTGYASVQTAIDALRQGADDYVTKPFEDIADLPAMIEKRLRGRRLRAENTALLGKLREQNGILQRHEQDLRERVERATWQMNTLYRVSIDIGTDLELEPRLRRIAETTARLMNARAAVVYLHHEESGGYEVAAVHGASRPEPGVSTPPVLAGSGPVGMAAFNLSAVRGGEPDGPPTPVPGLSETARTLLAVPLPQGARSLGVLLAIDRPEGFGDAEQEFLTLFASQAAVQIRNSQLYEHTKSLDRMKSDFVAVVSHETRTPLTSVKGALELLGDERYFRNNEQQAKLLAIAHANAERMLLLINDILDFSKLESASLPMTIERQRLEPVIEQAAHNLRMLIEERRIQLTIDLPNDLPDALVDAHRIAQVLTNLISNAIKFSPPGGRIEVGAEVHDDQIHIAVRDHGEGIAQVDLPKLFRKFQQIDSGSTRKVGGTGLGLVISKGIVEQHGGRIGVNSARGEGSTFWFSVPIARKEASSPAA
jgi:signal transduction histidine kinase/DNA-binding response OmpR family regulator